MAAPTVVTALWFGGSSYGTPDAERDAEVFPSVRAAVDIFRDRYDANGYPLWTYYRSRPNDSMMRFPVVDRSACMLLFIGADADTTGYPDYRVSFGPRGGVKIEPC